jgi:rfaE bifunctional protein nucleotidyltransferase chain/domain
MSLIITDKQELATWSASQRAAGKKVVFTNGVFDLLHAGHLDSLRRAKEEGDLLVVALNTDESVHRLKGEGRPILPLDQRMRLMAALEYVDCATSFDEETPANIIETVHPDILVKGGHYTIPEIVGHEFVQSYGGKVMSLPLVPGLSTSGIIETIQERFAK